MKFVEMIDIKDCDSTIIGCVEEPTIDKAGGEEGKWYLDTKAFVKMSDCSRWIDWDMSGDAYSRRQRKQGYNVDKITKVIDILTNIRHEMIRMSDIYATMKKEVEEHNASVNKDLNSVNKDLDD